MAGLDPLIRTLEARGTLIPLQKEAIARLKIVEREYRPGEDLIKEGDYPRSSIAILKGTVFRYRIVGEGRRQITAFHIPGDLPDLQALFLKRMDHSLAAASESVTAAHIPHDSITQLLDTDPLLAQLLWRLTLIDAAVFREWIVNIGRRDAVRRTAHILCELMFRMRAVGLAEQDSCKLAITQTHLSDALGLSLVHVNRSLKELREKKLISLRQGLLTIHGWKALVEIADFDPAYLHLK